MLTTLGMEVRATVQPHDVIDYINAASTVVVAVATAVLTGFAGWQIKQRYDERRDHTRRLDAVASYHALHLRRALQDAVTGLDALRLHDRNLGSWRQQASKVFNFYVTATRELEAMVEVMMERHAGTPAGIERLLHAIMAAFDAARELAGPVAPGMKEDEVAKLTSTAQQEANDALQLLHTQLHLPHRRRAGIRT